MLLSFSVSVVVSSGWFFNFIRGREKNIRNSCISVGVLCMKLM